MAQPSLSSINVFVVEDESFSASFIGRVLKNLNVGGVMTSVNGVEALKVLKEDQPKVDIFICDLEMPEMGGYEFIRQIRYGAVPKYKELPVLVLTREDTDENVKKSRFHRINGFIVKPPKASVLEQQMRKALNL